MAFSSTSRRDDDPYYAGVRRDGIGIMLKAILPDVLPQPNHARTHGLVGTRQYTLDPDTLFSVRERGASFVKPLSYIDDGLWGFEVTDADGYVLAFSASATTRGFRGSARVKIL